MADGLGYGNGYEGMPPSPLPGDLGGDEPAQFRIGNAG